MNLSSTVPKQWLVFPAVYMNYHIKSFAVFAFFLCLASSTLSVYSASQEKSAEDISVTGIV